MSEGTDTERTEAGTAADGLDPTEAAVRLRRVGPNILPTARRVHPIREFCAQLTHFFALMLWVAALFALVAGMPALAVAIAVVVLLNGGFAFAQEYRADRATERLRDLLPLRARVRRAGRVTPVAATELVPGDLIVLEAGDRVCADAVARVATGLRLDESMLTGESRPITIESGAELRAGTYVVAGQGEAEVTATGSRTRLAALAAVTARATRPRSPLTKQLHRVVRVVAIIAVSIGALSFATFTLLGRDPTASLLFAIGVTVALVPEGLLPTVTLSLARAAQRMAGSNALVRRLESVETLGATTFICTDKTGTLTRNEMQVVRLWTAHGTVVVSGAGYAPDGSLDGSPAAIDAVAALADSAARCSPDAHVVQQDGHWLPVGDPMEVALHVLASRTGRTTPPPVWQREPFDPHLRRAQVTDADGIHLTGAPEVVFARCVEVDAAARAQVTAMTERGLRVVAVARATAADSAPRLLGVVGLEDPPRPDVAATIAECRRMDIRLAMVTGDHPGTAAAVAAEVGLLGPQRIVLEGKDLPEDDDALGALLDTDGVVVARVSPEDKLRIARVLQRRGHVVAMTGDGVNDGPALHTADIGVAMGASGTDVAREAADLVLLDDHFATIVAAVRLGRATFANIRRFLTYHLTDNVAELAPFAFWAASGGSIPLGFTVLQVLALDIGTDMLPALALGAEPPNSRTGTGGRRTESLVDGPLLRRVFLALGPAEAGMGMAAFLTVLAMGGWRPGAPIDTALVATASGTLFAAVVLGQLTNAFACRSETRWVGVTGWRGNPLLLFAVAVELVLLIAFLYLPPLPGLLGGSNPGLTGWALALTAIPTLLLADTLHKLVTSRTIGDHGPAGTGIRPLIESSATGQARRMTTNSPRISVVFATAQGSTRDIAEFIGTELESRGAVVEIAEVEHAPDLSRFDAVVLGSAVHNMALLPALEEYVRSHRDELNVRDVWLFSVGLGPALSGPIGRRYGRLVPQRIAAVRDSIAPRDYRAFAGHYERVGVSLWARILYRVLGGGRYGDLRDWTAIRVWTDSIARTLGLPAAQSTSMHP
ncbi:HAD-IC family P-type ATPase [Nocardia otitidiscaviarum]|uniref:HAD-IC family P-type ATPase n=1 Tax=Nocardia otitidiscaviarum TaxID=1823 RepID=UPI001895711D|nr:HAD-IC family P-type ATPase [Nocardia otitidiscaviarum]MBF6182272.1 HAD-IC family P-type ATPase [Nocardia otitidiscaviarum]